MRVKRPASSRTPRSRDLNTTVVGVVETRVAHGASAALGSNVYLLGNVEMTQIEGMSWTLLWHREAPEELSQALTLLLALLQPSSQGRYGLPQPKTIPVAPNTYRPQSNPNAQGLERRLTSLLRQFQVWFSGLSSGSSQLPSSRVSNLLPWPLRAPTYV